MKSISFFYDYLLNYQMYKEKWNYEDGVVLEGAWDLYQTTKEIEYKQFILRILEEKLDREGNILQYTDKEFNIDNIKSGTVLLYLLPEYPQFRKAIEQLYKQIKCHPRNQEGSFFHKKIYPDQVWLDGAYMALPFYSKYIAMLEEEKNFDDVFLQFNNIKKNLYVKDKGLYVHGYDEQRRERWADSKTGKSKCFWLRAIGWLSMALVDCIEIIRPFASTKPLEEMLTDLLLQLSRYFSEKDNMWFQVVDRKEEPGNYPEVSGTSMICYSILKAIRLGLLQSEQLERQACASLEEMEETYLQNNVLTHICGVAGLGNTPYRDGSYEYYIAEPKKDNDPKGVGAYMMAYSEYLRRGGK